MSNIIPFVSKNPQKKKRFDILDAWRTLAILLMLVYHFLYDLLIFGVITPAQMFSPGLNLMQKFICCSFILLAGASARFSRSNLRHGVIVLLAGVAVEIGAAVGGQTIRFGILQFMGVSMVLWHFAGKYLQKLPRWLMMFVMWIFRTLDFYGKMPLALTRDDPNYATLFLTNLGSIKCPAVYHHLNNYGTNSIMMSIGTIRQKEVVGADGEREIREVVDLGVTIDERIADGFYFARSLKIIQHLLSNPELLDRPLKEEIEFVC